MGNDTGKLKSIFEHLQILTEELSFVHNVILELEKRLEPVMNSVAVEKAVTPAKQPMTCVVDGQLNDLTERAYNAGMKIKNILDRLEL